MVILEYKGNENKSTGDRNVSLSFSVKPWSAKILTGGPQWLLECDRGAD